MNILKTNLIKVKALVLILISFLLTISIQGQTASFDWASSSSWTNNNVIGIQNPKYVFPSASGFTIYSVEAEGTRVFAPKIIYISKFDATGNYMSSIDFVLPKRKLKDATLLKVIEGNNKLYFFSNVALKKDKKNTLYVQVYDNATATVGEIKELYTLGIEKVNNSGFFNLKIAKDKQTIVVLVNTPFVKKTKEAIKTIVLDADLNTISTSDITLSFKSKRAYNESLFVENDGTITLVKKTNIFKKNPITTAITIKGDAVVEQQISADKFYVSDHSVVSINNIQYLIGYATDNVKPTVSMGGAKDKSFFLYNLSDQKIILNQCWNSGILKKVLGKGFIDLKIKKILVHKNDIYLIGDRLSEKSKVIEGKNFEYDYTYNFGPGVVVKFNTNGEVAYDTFIKYGEEYVNSMKRLGSFYPFLIKGKLHLLANEKEHILKNKKIVMGYKKINAKAIVLKAFDALGNISTVPFWNSKVGGENDVTTFAPSQTIQLTDNIFYIYAYGKRYQSFGKITFD